MLAVRLLIHPLLTHQTLLSMSQHALLIASSSISYVVSQLEDKGWITREKDKDDKRVYMAIGCGPLL
jgi:DNA-binding MarR family transcriptional regulator